MKEQCKPNQIAEAGEIVSLKELINQDDEKDDKVKNPEIP